MNSGHHWLSATNLIGMMTTLRWWKRRLHPSIGLHRTSGWYWMCDGDVLARDRTAVVCEQVDDVMRAMVAPPTVNWWTSREQCENRDWQLGMAASWWHHTCEGRAYHTPLRWLIFRMAGGQPKAPNQNIRVRRSQVQGSVPKPQRPEAGFTKPLRLTKAGRSN